MYTLTLTDQEAKALITLLDIANKSAGLQVAEACILLSRKVQDAMTLKEPPKEIKKDK